MNSQYLLVPCLIAIALLVVRQLRMSRKLRKEREAADARLSNEAKFSYERGVREGADAAIGRPTEVLPSMGDAAYVVRTMYANSIGRYIVFEQISTKEIKLALVRNGYEDNWFVPGTQIKAHQIYAAVRVAVRSSEVRNRGGGKKEIEEGIRMTRTLLTPVGDEGRIVECDTVFYRNRQRVADEKEMMTIP